VPDLHHAAVRAVDLVNAEPADVPAVLVAHGETNLTGLAAEREQLHGVLAELRALLAITDRSEAAVRLNSLLTRHATIPQLVRHEGWDWHLHVDRVDDTWSNWLASSAALALAGRLTARSNVPWGTCAAHGCARAFLDDGHGGTRRYCSPVCATRQRVRDHRTVRRNRP